MEISADELAQMFTLHREHTWRWSLDPDERTGYPRSVEITLEGHTLQVAVVRLRYLVGPEIPGDVRVPFLWLLRLYDRLRLPLDEAADAVKQSIPCESTDPCAHDHTCRVHNALAPWLKSK